ncbi:glycerophosphodiester phosphodiesterase [Candidatus Thorarchaeota archaeon]|nr:MAG: glycerophosphodiester phosphodiesterase [Candidatus Thorarchaeota archaeon]
MRESIGPFDIDRPLIMAHRGDSANFPENTLPSLESAVKIGIDVLETDVHLTKDNELVLFHDEDIERTTGQQGTIRERTLEELREIDLGDRFTPDGENYPFRGKGLRVVTLREALERFPDVRFNVDIKDTLSKAPSAVARLLRDLSRENSVVVASFHPEQIKEFHRIAPEFPVAANPREVRSFVLGLKLRLLPLLVRSIPYSAFQVPVKQGSIEVVNSRFVKAAHDRQVAIHVWTINDAEEMHELLDLGVDGIFTDRPALLREVMVERRLL